MLLFAEPKPPRNFAPGERPMWRTVLFVAAIATAVTATQPWIRVQFVSLFGQVLGPPAWQDSTTGFTCLCTSALVAVMALVETQTHSAKQAVRPASLLLVAVMALSLLLYLLRGPGMLRGVTATWTFSLYLGTVGSVALLLACVARFRAMQPPRAAGPPRS